MRALYANSETSVAKNKAVTDGELTAIFPLGAQPDITRIQDIVRGLVPDAQFIAPEDFHITAVFVDSGDLEVVKQTLAYQYDFRAIALIADYIGYFETPDGYAIYLGVRWNSDLRYMQERLFYSMTGNGNMVSSFSMPEWWTPHITLAYSKSPVATFDIQPLAVLVNQIEISDANHDPLIQQEMKSDSLEFKAFDLEVICKGVEFNTEGDLIIPVMGCPFTGPVKGVADYQGDFFHKGTQFGDAAEVLTFWDHGREERYLIKELKSMGLDGDEIAALGSDFGFGKHDIGVAAKGAVTEEGIIYNIIVNRNTKYKHALAQAAKEGRIGASGEYKYFEYDKDVPGKVDFAPLVGMALTPSPFNTDARVLKSNTDPLEGEMEKVKKEVVVPAEGENIEAKDKAAEVVPPVEKKETLAESLLNKSAEIDKKIEAATVSEGEETISVADFNAVRSDVAEMKGMIGDFLEQMKEAYPILAEMISKSVLFGLNEKSKESDLEYKAAQVFGAKKDSTVNKGAGGGTGLRHNNSSAMSGMPGARN